MKRDNSLSRIISTLDLWPLCCKLEVISYEFLLLFYTLLLTTWYCCHFLNVFCKRYPTKEEKNSLGLSIVTSLPGLRAASGVTGYVSRNFKLTFAVE
jgi:hypothetical protein